MSYILDALKKSEAERSRGVVPTLLTPPQTPFRTGIVGWVLVAVLVVNAGLLVGWLYWPSPGSIAPAPTSETTTTTSPTVAPTSRTSDTPAATPQAPSQPLESPASVVAPPAPAPTASESSASVQSDAGGADVSFSTHVYATDPSMRAVTMNGKRFVEGDTIRSGVRIMEITETGVVLDVNGRRIPVDVLQDWH